MTRILESKVSPEGRVSIPAEIRRELGVSPGDRIAFVVGEDGSVCLMTAASLASSVWAKNTGGDAMDAADAVRAARGSEAEERQARWADEPWAAPSSDDVIAELFGRD